MSCIARTLGAPLTVPAGKQARSTSNGVTPSRSSPTTSETRCETCEKRSTSMSRATWTVPALQTRERSLRPRSTSITCSARSFSDESSRSTSPSVGSVVPAIGQRLARPFSQATSRSGEEPTSAIPSSSSRNRYGRRIDAPERPVDVERRGRGRPLGPLRRHALEDVAGDDVLLHGLDHLDVAVAIGRAANRAGRAPRLAAPGDPCVQSSGDLLDVTGEHLGHAGAVVEANERLADDHSAFRETAAGRRAAAPSARAAPRGRRRGSPRSGARARPPRRSRRSASRRPSTSCARAGRARPIRG